MKILNRSEENDDDDDDELARIGTRGNIEKREARRGSESGLLYLSLSISSTAIRFLFHYYYRMRADFRLICLPLSL